MYVCIYVCVCIYIYINFTPPTVFLIIFYEMHKQLTNFRRTLHRLFRKTRETLLNGKGNDAFVSIIAILAFIILVFVSAKLPFVPIVWKGAFLVRNSNSSSNSAVCYSRTTTNSPLPPKLQKFSVDISLHPEVRSGVYL